MMAPVIFFMFLNSFGTLVIGDKNITTLVFEEPVGRVHHGLTKNDVYVEKTPDGKMVFIKSLGREVDTNLSIPTKSGKLYSFRILRDKIPHSIVRIRDGKQDSLFKLAKKSNLVTIEQGENSIKLKNRSNHSIKVNGLNLPSKEVVFLPSGPAVYVNNERFYK